MADTKKSKHARASGSLNLILWFSFTVFALILLVLFLAVQSLLLGSRYRGEVITQMQQASREMTEVLSGSEEGFSLAVWRRVRELEDDYDVHFLLLYTDGRNVFSDGAEDDSYPEIAESLKERIYAGGNDVVFVEGDVVAYASVVTIGGQNYFLYVSNSIAQVNSLEESLRWLSLGTGLFSVVLAFVASGFVAMLITKPVTEVTEQAKELARGNYALDFKRDYFCLEMSELSDALDYARREISRTDTMQKELIANVSHDFKTPLTMIKAYASMIREISGEDKAKREAHADVIIEEADRLTALVNDVLDLGKLRAGGSTAPVVFNLSETVYKIVARFDYLCETQGFVFETDIAEDRYVLADRNRTEQVIYNLIGNAVNYTGEDKHVRIRLMAAADRTRLEVEDTGKGIPAEEQATIWDRYYRSSEAHRRPVQGTGLGLSIVKEILLQQNCPFGVQSEEGKGSIFWVEFSLPPEDGEELLGVKGAK